MQELGRTKRHVRAVAFCKADSHYIEEVSAGGWDDKIAFCEDCIYNTLRAHENAAIVTNKVTVYENRDM